MGDYMAYLHEIYTEKWACEQEQKVTQQEQQQKGSCSLERNMINKFHQHFRLYQLSFPLKK